jgi:hypothetical protein
MKTKLITRQPGPAVGMFTRRFRKLIDTMYPDDRGPATSELGLATTTIHNLYQGKTKAPRLEHVLRLAERLGLPAGWFLSDSDEDTLEKAQGTFDQERVGRMTLPVGLGLRMRAQVAMWRSHPWHTADDVGRGVQGGDILSPLSFLMKWMPKVIGERELPYFLRLVLDQREALYRTVEDVRLGRVADVRRRVAKGRALEQFLRQEDAATKQSSTQRRLHKRTK